MCLVIVKNVELLFLQFALEIRKNCVGHFTTRAFGHSFALTASVPGFASMPAAHDNDDAASDASSLDDLPGPDEFLATAIQKLSLKVSPERGSPLGGFTGLSPSAFPGSGLDGGSAGANDDPNASETSSVTYDETELLAIGEFLEAAASPLRPNSPLVVDDRPSSSPKRAMEEMTASLKLEHRVTEAVVEDIIDEAEMRVAYPDTKPVLFQNDLNAGVLLRDRAVRSRLGDANEDDLETETPMETAPTSPSPSVSGNLHLLDEEQFREIQKNRLTASRGGESADEAMRQARARLSDALRTVAETLTSDNKESGCVTESEMEENAVGVAEAIALVWHACDSACAALATALEREDFLESNSTTTESGSGFGTAGAPFSVSNGPGPASAGPTAPNALAAKEKRAMLEEAVFSAWMQSGETSSNLMWSEGPLPTTKTWPLSPGAVDTETESTKSAKAFAAAAADAAFCSPPSSLNSGREEGHTPRSADRARRWRSVVKQLALASLRRVSSEMGEDDSSFDFTAAGSDLDQSITTSTFLPVPPGSPSLSPSQNTQDRESSEKGLRDFFGDNAPPGPASSSPPPTPHAVHRSGTRSALEWDDLRLIATYMTTTRLLSAGLDEWRARTSSAKTRRRLAREQRRVVAVAERERCRVEFARQVLIRWRETCHTLTRERRARYGSVSRASIRKLTRSPAHARGRSPMSPNSNVSRSGGSGGTPGYGSERKSHGGTGGRFSPNGSERFVMTTGSGARVVSASGRLSEEEFSSSRRTTETR